MASFFNADFFNAERAERQTMLKKKLPLFPLFRTFCIKNHKSPILCLTIPF